MISRIRHHNNRRLLNLTVSRLLFSGFVCDSSFNLHSHPVWYIHSIFLLYRCRRWDPRISGNLPKSRRSWIRPRKCGFKVWSLNQEVIAFWAKSFPPLCTCCCNSPKYLLFPASKKRSPDWSPPWSDIMLTLWEGTHVHLEVIQSLLHTTVWLALLD